MLPGRNRTEIDTFPVVQIRFRDADRSRFGFGISQPKPTPGSSAGRLSPGQYTSGSPHKRHLNGEDGQAD